MSSTVETPRGEWTPPPPPAPLKGLARLRAAKARMLGRLRGEQDVDALVAQGLQLGENVFIASGTTLDGGFPWLITIGDHVTISSNVHVLVHDASPRRHIGYSVVAPVRIGRRAYIGAGVIILPGVTIGADAIVGAGAVVSRDVPPGAIAVGCPARVVGTTEDLVARHRALLDERPCYPKEGYTAATDPTDATRRQMQRELADGHGYVP